MKLILPRLEWVPLKLLASSQHDELADNWEQNLLSSIIGMIRCPGPLPPPPRPPDILECSASFTMRILFSRPKDGGPCARESPGGVIEARLGC